MTTTGPFVAREADVSRLRVTIALIDRDLARLPVGPPSDELGELLGSLRASFADLVAQLGLGAEPELRPCPACHRRVRRAATRCGFCWSTLAPLAVPGSLDLP